jgi:hypothetical protein
MKVLKVDVRVGDSVSFDKGRVSVTLLEKSGQRARLEIKSEPDVVIDLPRQSSAAQQAQKGISQPTKMLV